MKPLILKMQAFGPYAGQQTVDFRSALDEGIFGIYGATGSGKSSIFNAMAFALFGAPLKSIEPDALRSQFADKTTPTVIEFIFTAGTCTYRVVRQLDLERPKRGGGTKKDGKKALLFDVTGLDPATVNDDNPGKVVVEKLNEVTPRIEEILGYRLAQFKQIVLLPQGEFEKFLASSSTERMEILRKLFDVRLYEKLVQRFTDRARDASDTITRRREIVAGRLAGDGYASIEALVEGIATTGTAVDTAKAGIAVKEQELAAAETAVRIATAHKDVFNTYFKAKDAHATMEVKRPAMAMIAERLRIARHAQSVLPLVQRVTEEQERLASAEATVTSTAKAAAQALSAHGAARDALAKTATKLTELPALQTSVIRLEGYATIVEGSEALKLTASDAETRLAKALSSAEKALAASTSATATAKAARQKHQSETGLQAERITLIAALSGLRAERRNAASHAEVSNQLVKDQQAVTSAETILRTAEDAFTAAQSRFVQAEQALIDDHAALLATTLVGGQPCPVCGSTDHPKPHGSGPGGDVGAALAKARAERDEAGRAVDKARAVLGKRNEALAGQRGRLEGITPPTRPEAEISADIDAAESRLEALGPMVDLPELASKADKAEEDAQVRAEGATEATNERQAAQSARDLARQALTQALDAVPEELRQIDALNRALTKTRNAITSLETLKRDAEQAERDTNSQRIEAEALAVSAATARAAALSRVNEAVTQRDTALHKADLTLDTVVEVKDLSIETLEGEIRAFEREETLTTTALTNATEAIKDIHDPEIEPLLDALTIAKQNLRDAQDRLAELNTTLKGQEQDYQKLKDEIEAIQSLELESAPVRDLASHMAGNVGARMPLDTFAIATMFDAVLDAANLRMHPMTKGRFSLIREPDTRGGGRKGLELSVSDTYTGGTRRTGTLSGGETFITALSLALGLSDVVESQHGNIQLDTLFIDEGFGSLDADNDSGTLDLVLNALQDVGHRRAVGVISHVPLVRQYISKGFEITGTATGSSIRSITASA